jgi:hypothetical protein
MLIILLPLLILWLLVAVVVIAACRMAAAADAPDTRSLPRPRAWDAVRERIVAAPHSDRLATYW